MNRRRKTITGLFDGFAASARETEKSGPRLSSPSITNIHPPFESIGDTGAWDERRIRRALHIRRKLKTQYRYLADCVGGENIELSFAARHGFSTDSTGFRGCTSEAVFMPPDIPAMRALVRWCNRNRIPMIPYGAGGGYNMGVVPKTPAVTIWSRCIGAIGDIIPHPRPGPRSRHAIWVDAGVPYTRLVEEIERRGYVIRCMPNTPRASVGGVVATGSNGGKRIAEIVIAGEALLPDGRLVTFRTTGRERRFMREHAFPLLYKYHGISAGDIGRFPSNHESHEFPASLFVAAEGTTGIITRVLLEIEEAPKRALTAGIWFSDIHMVAQFVKALHAGPEYLKPVYFELLTEPAIGRYIAADFPDLFSGKDDAYIILSFESDDNGILTGARTRTEENIPRGLRTRWVGPYDRHSIPPQARRLIEPREVLPTKMKSKCKADTEIRLDFLPRAIRLLSQDRTSEGDPVESILFGHLSPPNSAILHWNIGGIDPSREQTTIRAWNHLEKTLDDLMRPDGDGNVRAAFTGEHGAAAKPYLFRSFLSRTELARQTRIKRRVDPRRLMNPHTLYLPTRFSRSLVATALRFQPEPGRLSEKVRNLLFDCTRCNACQECHVIDSQSAIRRQRSPRPDGGWLMGKRHLLQILEYVESGSMRAEEMHSLVESAISPLSACISCGKCDEACPADIPLSELKEELWRLHGREPSAPAIMRLLYRLMLAPSPRSIFLWCQGMIMRFLNPIVGRFHNTHSSPLLAYGAMAPLGSARYHPQKSIPNTRISGDLIRVGTDGGQRRSDTAVLRFRGCVGTLGHADTTVREDIFLTRYAGISFFDFEPDLCCGYPYHAAGMYREASKRRDELKRRLLRNIEYLQRSLGYEKFTIISSCPTCREALRTASAHSDQSMSMIPIVDPVEIPGDARLECDTAQSAGKRIGLKVPCHSTASSIDMQTRLLKSRGYEVIPLMECCGMAGTGRIMHPEIGAVLAERLASRIAENNLTRVVSGCPACRDGMKLQGTLSGASFSVSDMYTPLLDGSGP